MTQLRRSGHAADFRHEVRKDDGGAAEHAQALTGSRVGAATAAQHLNDMFGGGGGSSRGSGAATTVVVVDEMDLLLNRNQHVRALYGSSLSAHPHPCRAVISVLHPKLCPCQCLTTMSTPGPLPEKNQALVRSGIS